VRKRIVTDEELNQIIKLTQSGASWLRIQDQTGVPRRTARNAFKEWEHTKTLEELKNARVDVAADELREHIDQIMSIVDLLSINLRGLSIKEVSLKADDFLFSLWVKKPIPPEGLPPDKNREERENRRLKREFQMLLSSLQHHTREKVNWELLEQWKRAWDKCKDDLSNLLKDSKIIEDELIAQDTTGIIDNINKKREINTAYEETAKAGIDVIWQNIIDGTFDTENLSLNITYDIFNGAVGLLIDREEYKNLEQILKPVADQFCKNNKKRIRILTDDVLKINEITNKLDEMLNPLVLRPLILHTKCEICPA